MSRAWRALAALLVLLIAAPAFAPSLAAPMSVGQHLRAELPKRVVMLGDSRVNLAGGMSAGGSAYSIVLGEGGSYVGWMFPALGNKVLTPPWGNFGLTGASTLNLLNDLTSPANHAGTTNGTAGQNPAFGATTGFIGGNGCNNAGTGTGSNADKGWHVASDGIRSLTNIPPAYVALLAGVNDPASTTPFYLNGATPCTDGSPVASWGMRTMAAILDRLGAAGHETWLFDETPGGYYMIYFEGRTPSGGTFSPSQTTGFLDGDSFFPGNSGAVIFESGSPIVETPATKVGTCAGVDNTYSLSGTTFTACGTAPSKAYITYAYTSTNTTNYNNRHAYLVAYHEWLKSSASAFTWNSNSYGFSGALYGRNVKTVPTWAALLDPATAGSTDLALPGAHYDGLHFSAYGGQLISQVFAPFIAAAHPELTTSLAKAPTKNNVIVKTISSSAKRVNGNACGAATSAGFDPADVAAGGVSFLANVLGPPHSTTLVTDDGTGNLVGASLDTGQVHTISHTTPCAYDFTYTTTPGNGSFVVAQLDPTNLLTNGLLTLTQGSGTNNFTNATGGSNVPLGWTLATDAGTTTATGASPTLTVAVSATTDDQGYPATKFTFIGNPGSGTQTTFAQTVQFPDAKVANGERLRAGARVAIGGATCGGATHLYGLYNANIKLAVSSLANTFNRPGYTTNFTSMTVEGQKGSSGQPFTDQNLITPIIQEQLTPLLDLGLVSLGSTSALTATLAINYNTGVPVCFAVTVSQLHANTFLAGR